MLDNFDPRTPTEQALWNEVRKLRAKVYYLERATPSALLAEPIDLDGRTPRNDLDVTLPLTVKLAANVDPSGDLVIRGMSKSSTEVLVHEHRLAYPARPRSKLEAADRLSDLWREHMRELADVSVR